MKRLSKVLVVLVLVFTLAGCTQYMKDAEKKNVINKETGQALTSNILCKPTKKELLELYTENNNSLKIKLEKLPECKSMKYNDLKYDGIWEAIFVKPLALVIVWIGNLVKNYGLAVMLVGLLIRVILMPLTAKTLMQSQKMKDAQVELKKLEKKYENKNDKDAMMAKSQETMTIYKKYGINPFTSCLGAFVQLPLFFAFLEAINRVPAIFEGKFLGLQLGTTPWVGVINKGNYLYIIVLVLIIISTYFSFKQSMSATTSSDQANQTKFMTNFMLIFIAIASVNLPTAIGLYWIATNLFAVVQHGVLKRKV